MTAFSFRSALTAAMQSAETAAPVNGFRPLVQVATFAPKPPPAALPDTEKPAPKFGADITARRRSSEATPVVMATVVDSPRWTVRSQLQSMTGILPSKPPRMLYVLTSVDTARLPRPGT